MDDYKLPVSSVAKAITTNKISEFTDIVRGGYTSRDFERTSGSYFLGMTLAIIMP